MNPEDNFENQSISRLATKKQSLDDMYSAPANFLGNSNLFMSQEWFNYIKIYSSEIDVINPSTTIVAGKKKFTDYEIRMRVSWVLDVY
jgi:sorting nexin-3/12